MDSIFLHIYFLVLYFLLYGSLFAAVVRACVRCTYKYSTYVCTLSVVSFSSGKLLFLPSKIQKCSREPVDQRADFRFFTAGVPPFTAPAENFSVVFVSFLFFRFIDCYGADIKACLTVCEPFLLEPRLSSPGLEYFHKGRLWVTLWRFSPFSRTRSKRMITERSMFDILIIRCSGHCDDPLGPGQSDDPHRQIWVNLFLGVHTCANLLSLVGVLLFSGRY